MDDMNNPVETLNDLDTLPVEELHDLRRHVDRAIKSFEDRRRKAALAALEETARAHGLKLSELVGEGRKARSSSPRASYPPAYADPDDPSRTWSGRGRRPGWVNAALEQGKTLEDLAI